MQRANNSQHGEEMGMMNNNSMLTAHAARPTHAESGPTRPKPSATVAKQSRTKINNNDKFTQEESELLERLDDKTNETKDKALPPQQDSDAANVVITYHTPK